MESINWGHLTRHSRKRELYTHDPAFNEAAKDFHEGIGEAWTKAIFSYGLILFKPEAIAGRRVRTALNYLRRHGFEVVSIHGVIFDETLTHALWRYQLNLATPDRIRLQTIFRPCVTTILLLVWDSQSAHQSQLPAQVKLKHLKGAARPEMRHQDSLRSVLSAPNALLNFIHGPDEPADFVRELGILLSRHERMELLKRLSPSDDAECRLVFEGRIETVERSVPEHDIAPSLSRGRLCHWLEQQPLPSSALEKRRAIISKLSTASEMSLGELEHHMASCRIDFPALRERTKWDIFVGMSDLILLDRENTKAVINGDDLGEWP